MDDTSEMSGSVHGGNPLALYAAKKGTPMIIMAVVTILAIVLIIIAGIVLGLAKNIQWGLPLLFVGLATGVSFWTGYFTKTGKTMSSYGEQFTPSFMPSFM
jgi:hypothetical protein